MIESSTSYPCPLGYCSVGEIIQVADSGESHLIGQKVFSFSPHQEESVLPMDSIVLLPSQIKLESMTLIANMETAISIVADLQARIGESIGIVGGGIVGQLCTQILSRIPGIQVHVIEPQSYRAQFLPEDAFWHQTLDSCATKFDALVEVSGKPEALETAFAHCKNDGRLIAGSWFGDQPTQVKLNTDFHKRRLRLFSSQVSNIPAHQRDSLPKAKRLKLAIDFIRKFRLEELISHSIPFHSISRAYDMIQDPSASFNHIVISYHEEDYCV